MSKVAGDQSKPSTEPTSTDTSKEEEKGSASGTTPVESGEGWFEDLDHEETPEETDKTVEKQDPPPKGDDKPADDSKDTEKGSKDKPDKDTSKDSPTEDPKVAELEKRVKDSRDAFTQERQRNVELGRQIEQLTESVKTLQAKVDGTYEEPKPEDAKQASAKASMNAKVAASNYAAVELLMARDGMTKEAAEAHIMDTVWKDDGPYMTLEKGDPAIRARVMESPVPVIEALRVVKEHSLKAKYGDDPEAMRAALRTEVEAEILPTLTKKIRDEILAELKEGRPKDKAATVPRGGGARSVQPENSDLGDTGDSDFSALWEK